MRWRRRDLPAIARYSGALFLGGMIPVVAAVLGLLLAGWRP